MEAGSPLLYLQRDELCQQYLPRLENFPVYKNKLNALNNERDAKYEQNKLLLLSVGFRSRPIKQVLELDPDSFENEVADVQPWLLKSINIFLIGVTETRKT